MMGLWACKKNKIISVFGCILLFLSILLNCQVEVVSSQSLALSSLSVLGNVVIRGSGSYLLSVGLNEFNFIYQFVNSSVTLTFNTSGTNAGISSLLLFNSEYAAIDFIPPTSNIDVYARGLDTYPVLASAISFVYNLPGLPVTSPLYLTRQIILAIFLGQIKYWNDPALVAVNPNIKDYLESVNETIAIVTRSDAAGTNYILSDAFSSYSSTWRSRFGVASVIAWPFTNYPSRNATILLNTVSTIPFTFGYAVHSDTISRALPYAFVRNRAGNYIDPSTTTAISGAMADGINSFNYHLVGSLVDGNGSTSYPFVGLSYFLLWGGPQYPPNSNCERISALLDWIVWFQTNTAVSTQARALGYGTLSPRLLKRLVDKLALIKCILPISASLNYPDANGTVTDVVPADGLSGVSPLNITDSPSATMTTQTASRSNSLSGSVTASSSPTISASRSFDATISSSPSGTSTTSPSRSRTSSASPVVSRSPTPSPSPETQEQLNYFVFPNVTNSNYIVQKQSLLDGAVQALRTQVLVGSGANLPQWIFTVWIRLYSVNFRENPTVISYTLEGSTLGKSNILEGNTDFGSTDLLPTDKEKAKYPFWDSFLWVPVIGVGMTPMYNYPGSPQIIFDGPTLARIWLGNITRWNDPALVALNPDLQFANRNISLVYRSEASAAATSLWVLQMAYYSEAFAARLNATGFVDSGSQLSWPTFWGNNSIANRNSINAANPTLAIQYVNSGSYTLGYSPISDILSRQIATNNIKTGSMVNAAGNVVSVTQDSISNAMGDFTEQIQTTTLLNIVNGSGDQSWPLSSFSYIILNRNYSTANFSQLYQGNGSYVLPSAVAQPSSLGNISLGARKRQADVVYPTTVSSCAKIKSLLDFLAWTQDDISAAEVGRVLFYGIPTLDVQRQIFLDLAQVYCDGKPMLSALPCLNDGDLCSLNGDCDRYAGTCECYAGWEGDTCERRIADPATDKTKWIIIGSVLGAALLLALIIAVIVAIVLIYWLNSSAYARYRRGRNWIIDYNSLDIDEPIGQGGHGTVYRANFRGSPVAVKVLADQPDQVKELQADFVKEVQIMADLRHPCVVLFMGACIKHPHLAIVMEYLSLGSLYNVLHNESITTIPDNKKIKMALQTAQGMQYLHSSGVIHRDLKSHNLLMDEDWNVKISDFGLTKFKTKLEAKNEETDKQMGTIYWTAPEALESSIYSEQTDVYSYGIVLWEIYTRNDPYEGLNPTTVAIGVIRDDLRPDLPEDTSEIWRTPIVDCWARDPETRPSFASLAGQFQLYYNESSGSASTGHHQTGSDVWAGADGGDSSGGNSKFVLLPHHKDRGIAAPEGDIAIVFSDVSKASALWEKCPHAMKDATLIHNTIVRTQLEKFKGYEVALLQMAGGEGSFCAAFTEPHAALDWAVATQEEMLIADWPNDLLEQPEAMEQFDDNDKVIFRGLQVRIGMNYGATTMGIDPLTRKVGYVGPTVSLAARATTVAQGGQTLITERFYDKLREDRPKWKKWQKNKFGVVTKSSKTLEIMDESQGEVTKEKIYEVKPTTLASRFFTTDKAKIKKSKNNSNRSTDDSATDDTDADEGQSKEDSYLTSANLCRWIINYQQIAITRLLGAGSYGVVYKGKWKGIDVAVKKIVKQNLTERRRLEFRAEVALISQLHHPNIVMFIGACFVKPNLCVVTEYIKKGNLRDILANHAVVLSNKTKLKLAKGIALGLNYLHSLSPQIVHRDLKSSNVLVDDTMTAKLADFGFARIKEENATMTRCGTPCWTAPEIIRGEKYDEKVDVYSFGIVMWELFTRQKPFSHDKYVNVVKKVLEGERPVVPQKNSPSRGWNKWMTKCWSGDAKERPETGELVDYFTNEIGEDEDEL